MSIIWEIDITNVIDFLNEKKKIYPVLSDIFKGLCWRLQRSEEIYYNDKHKVYMIKSNGGYSHGLFMTLAVKVDDNNKIKKIAAMIIEDKKNGIVMIHPSKNKK